MKKIIYLAAAFLCMACSDDHESDQQHGGASGSVTEVTPVTSDLSVGLSTDKASYKPGEKVVFTADNALPAGTKVRYRLSGETVGEESVNGTGWTWHVSRATVLSLISVRRRQLRRRRKRWHI